MALLFYNRNNCNIVLDLNCYYFMLQLVSGNQLNFQPYSESDLRLKGVISIKNANPTKILIYKIKSTDVSAFEADPCKGILDPRQSANIAVVTNHPVDADYARTLAQKHKFLVEYMLLDSKPGSPEDALARLKDGPTESVKIYLNTSSVRDSKLSSKIRQPSVAGSNRYSFRSLVQNQQPRETKVSSRYTSPDPSEDNIKKLNQQIQYLEKQREKATRQFQNRARNKGGSNLVKYVIIAAVGVVAGNLASKHSGLQPFISQSLHSIRNKIGPKQQQQEGILSIFNIGDEESAGVKTEEKSWWNIF